MANYCDNYKAIATTTQGKVGELWLTRGRCKRWSCEYCAYINKVLWQRHIMRGIARQKRKYWWFVTLTASSSAHKSGKTLENLQRAWKRLYDRLARKFKAYRPIYVWVFEPHQSGKLHIHAIISFNAGSGGMKRRKLDKHGNDTEVTRWFKDTMAKLGAGYQASCKPVDSSGGITKKAAYVCKYLTKRNQEQFTVIQRFRFVHTSQHFGALRQKSELRWVLASGVHKKDLAYYQRIKDLNKNRYLNSSDFKDNSAYPPEIN